MSQPNGTTAPHRNDERGSQKRITIMSRRLCGSITMDQPKMRTRGGVKKVQKLNEKNLACNAMNGPLKIPFEVRALSPCHPRLLSSFDGHCTVPYAIRVGKVTFEK